MASDTRHAKLIAEIAVLHQEHLEFLSEAIFKGWTRETKAGAAKCNERIAALYRELTALDSTSKP